MQAWDLQLYEKEIPRQLFSYDICHNMEGKYDMPIIYLFIFTNSRLEDFCEIMEPLFSKREDISL